MSPFFASTKSENPRLNVLWKRYVVKAVGGQDRSVTNFLFVPTHNLPWLSLSKAQISLLPML
jgi:hypothetical protein